MRAIFVMGRPGAGKTTLAGMLSSRFGFSLFQGGKLLRLMADDRTASRSAIARRILAQGAPIPVELYCEMISSSEQAHSVSAVFDGYPRDTNQCLRIPEVLDAAGLSSAAVIGVFLSADDQAIKDRVEARRICQNCGGPWEPAGICCSTPKPVHRADDLSSTLVRKRIELYEANAAEIRAYFASRAAIFDAELGPPDALRPLLSYLMTQNTKHVRPVPQ